MRGGLTDSARARTLGRTRERAARRGQEAPRDKAPLLLEVTEMRTARMLLLLPAALACLAVAAPAQSCPGATGTLTVTPNTCVMSGDTISIQACGSGGTFNFSFAFLAISPTLGTSTFGPFGPIPAVTLCLESPGILPLGMTNSSGCANRTITVPSGVPLPGNINLQLQALIVGISITPPSPPNPPSISITITTTNTDTLCL